MDKKSAPWQDFLDHAELSDVGLRRSNNQDSFNFVIAGSDELFRARGHVFMVADGMGAHAAGELASKMAVDNVTLTYYKLREKAPPDALKTAIEEANTKIHSRGEDNPDFKGMGTTSSVLAILPEGAVVGHVGDSRVYRLRGNRLEQLSADHSLVWEMAANNRVSEKDLPGYIPKNIITRSLGPSESVQPDLEGPFPLLEGDTFLLCSDGLSGQVGDEEMGVIMGALPPQEAVRVLVDLANLRGGPDNITVIVLRVNSTKPLAGGGRGSGSSAGGQKGSVSVIPAVFFGVLLLATVFLAISDQLQVALFTGVAALAAGAVVFLQRFGGSGGQAESTGVAPGRLGRGPHRSFVCSPSQQFLDSMTRMIEPVLNTAQEQRWDIDLPGFEAYRKRSNDAADRQDYLTAAREYCHAITFLMQEVRDQRLKATEGPIVDIEGG
jgi:protein phosphatase